MLSSVMLNLVAGRLVQAFCWMLVHSLWIGAVFTVLTGLVLMATTRSRPALRYNLVAALFFLFLAACGVSFFMELLITGSGANHVITTIPGTTEVSGLRQLFQSFLDYYAAHTSWVFAAWTVFFCWKGLNLTGAIAYNHRLRQHKLPITDTQWNQRFGELIAKMGLRQPVAFFESAMIKIPVVIGHLRPVIFLPAAVLANLSPAEVEAVLLHELAHIRRKDYLVNLCQLAGETVFAFNPALLWISAILREEREACCDDLAIAATQSKKGFIQALVSFREHAALPSRYTMAFPAAKNQLLKRVSRIVHNRNTALDAGGKTFFIASLLLLGIVVKAATDSIAATPLSTEAKNSAIAILVSRRPTVANGSPQQVAVAMTAQAKTAKRERVARVSGGSTTANAKRPEPVVLQSEPNKIVSIIPEVEHEQASEHTEMDKRRGGADEDRLQAERDRAQAILDRAQAAKDREQAMRDREQAEKDRAQAIKDRAQAERDRVQAQADRARADRERMLHKERTGIEI